MQPAVPPLPARLRLSPCHLAWAALVGVIVAGIAGRAGHTALAADDQPRIDPSSPLTTMPSTGPASALAATVPSAVIDGLIVDLASDDWRRRDAAQDKLVKLAGEAEPALREFAARTQNLEGRTRAKDALSRIADLRWTGPSMVTLHRREAPAAAVFEEIFRQAGAQYSTYPLELLQGGVGPIDVNFQRTPFLEALREVCGKTDLNARFVYDRQHITLMREANAPMKGPSTVNGPVLFCADGVNWSASVQFANPAAPQRSGALTFTILLEPRLKVTHGWFEAQSVEDENRKSLLLVQPAGLPNNQPTALTYNSEFLWTGNVPIQLSRQSTRISRFRGILHLNVHSRTEHVEIRDVLKAKEVTRIVDGRRFTLHSVTPTAENFTMQLTMYRGELAADDWAWFSYPYGRIRLIDAQGGDLSPTSGGGGGGPESNFQMVMTRTNYGQAAAIGEPVALVWDLPLMTRELSIPISFDNLPLP